MIRELVNKNRSYRRFYEEKRIPCEELMELVEICHNTPSAANRQPLRYRLVTQPEVCDKVFATLGWAGYLTDWAGPPAGERPAAYVILLAQEGTNCQWDEGVASQTLLLAAVEKGYGGCILGNIRRDELAKALEIPEGMAVKLVIALGVPKEEVVLETIREGEDIRYYRDKNMVHHVPKFDLKDIII